MARVRDECSTVDDPDEVVTAADIANFVEHPADLDPAADLRLIEVDGRVVGYGWINHRVESGTGDEIHSHRGYVSPEWRRRGLGSALIRYFWQRASARRLVDATGSARLLQTFMLESETGTHALVAGLGYAPARLAFRMRRDLSEPIPDRPLPEGLEIRAARPEHFRAIWEAEREAFADHWGYTPWPEQAFQRFVDFPHYDPALWQIAWDGDQVAGMVLNYIHQEENRSFGRRRGYTEDIAVRRPWRRRGLASALIARSLKALRERGMTEAVLAVDAENRTGALRLYERLGYAAIKQWTIYRRPLPVD